MFNFEKAFTNPDYNRAEWRAYIGGPMLGDGAKFYFMSYNVETAAYAINSESTEAATIAQYLPVVSNTDGGITFPHEWKLSAGSLAQQAILAAGLLGKVDQEFDLLLVYGNIEVLEGGTEIADAAFAQRGKVKFTISSIGGAGAEKSVVTVEGKTSGDIQRGIVDYGTASNYDPDEETWLMAAFTEKVNLGIADLRIRAGV